MRRESRTGSSRNTREARRLTRVANRDAVGRMFSMLVDRTFDPEPRCMLFVPVQMRTTRTGMLNIYKHSKTLWKLQLLEIFVPLLKFVVCTDRVHQFVACVLHVHAATAVACSTCNP